ncbi:hypothetical protein [Dendronalium sp. ChiSLP03b]|uniref:hypothetical protein n=1 Tax=Dendronalium sp. ChiSLP03b TaxID=3075381 RepID=UPI002AD22885|nr:hypothetical protein [Dendronalium sp. ChiSLP03b]MDZ8206729.1 hypothetical protein [Dendronalium sp. ChiSLP03b]
MTYQQLQTGDYFRISGLSTGYVYRKASDTHCSLHGMLQPIRPHTPVRKMTAIEVQEHFAQQQSELTTIKKAANK